MKTYNNLWQELCSYDNLELAYKRARKHKTLKPYVIEFEKELTNNLLLLRTELLLHSYRPKPLEVFIIHDPKTRKISKSDFRDRVIHHALCNIIEPIFDKRFIEDSYANRINKGTLKAIERFDYFKRKVSRNDTISCYVLKCDIKKYFENINHDVLLSIIKKKIKDNCVLWLIKIIITNHVVGFEQTRKGMPLGNLTSQFFANIYLNELDYFVKYELKIRYYIRYVDDFVILCNDGNMLQDYKNKINEFLIKNLKVELHSDKSKIINLTKGINFLGFRVFYYNKLLRETNIRSFKRKFEEFKALFSEKKIIYDEVYESFQGWYAYAEHANTYELRKEIGKQLELCFSNKISSIEINRWLKAVKTI